MKKTFSIFVFVAFAYSLILVDPQAAQLVLGCGRPISMLGLDVTHQVLCSRDRIARISELDNPAARATAGMLGFFSRHDTEKYKKDGAPLHDPCTIALLLRPDLFEGKSCNVEVETASPLTMGHTAVDFWGVSGRPANVTWVYQVDADGFFELLLERLGTFGEAAR